MYVLFALSGIGCFRRFQRRVTNKETKVCVCKGHGRQLPGHKGFVVGVIGMLDPVGRNVEKGQ